MKKITPRIITIIAFSVALNYLGSTIALLLRLPIYLDSAGTIFTGALLGPLFGALTGILTSLVTGLTTDIFSLYYSPVQLCTGILAGLLLHQQLKVTKLPFKTLWLTIPGNSNFFLDYSLFIWWNNFCWLQYNCPIFIWFRLKSVSKRPVGSIDNRLRGSSAISHHRHSCYRCLT